MIQLRFLMAALLFTGFFKGSAQSNAFLPTKLKTTTVLKTQAGVAAQANGIKCAAVNVFVDTSIRVAPKNAYLSVDFSAITGSDLADILGGENLFWVFDKAGKEIKITDKLLKKVNSAMENSLVNMTVKIPYRLKTDANIYSIHYRWQSRDKLRTIDLLTSK